MALVAVTDHAVERYGERVRGTLDPRMEDRPRGELIVVTLWEEGEEAAVQRRWTR
ncbi:MAG: hypothetical protein ACRDK0_04100 [Solirubrobacteraceae bacterium]